MKRLKCGHDDTVAHLLMGFATTLVATLLNDQIFPPAFEALKDTLTEEFEAILKDHGVPVIEAHEGYAERAYSDPKTARPVLDSFRARVEFYLEKMKKDGTLKVVEGQMLHPENKTTH